MEIPAELLNPNSSWAVAHRFYFHQPGIITGIEGIPAVESMPKVFDYVEQRPFKVGDQLESLEYINRLFYVITRAETIPEAIACAEAAINSVKIRT